MGEDPEPPDDLEISVRVFTTRPVEDRSGQRATRPPRPARKQVRRTYPAEALIFDTETTTGPTQRLQVGVWRLYVDRDGSEPGMTCVEEGIFHADDLAATDPGGFARLRAYVADRRDADTAAGFPKNLLFMSASDWLRKRFYRYGCAHRWRPHSDVVGFNLGFDLGRLARHWGAGRGRNRGAFTLSFVGAEDHRGAWHDIRYYPRLIVRSIDPRRTLFSWGTSSDEESHPARFVDLHTLVFALTDENHSLESAGAAFGDVWEKDPIPYGVIDARSLDYARDDVRHTAILYRNCLAELRRHVGIDLDPARLYSPATVGSAYLKAMGVAHPLERFMADPATVADDAELAVDGRIHPRVMGFAMSGFFGGRAEARIVRQAAPVTLVDASSMYPTVNANLRTWELFTADRLEIKDASDELRSLLAAPDLLERLLRRETWADAIGVALVELDGPKGEILPIRARYEPFGPDPGIGINPLTYDGRLWYPLPDVLAATILTGRPPSITRAIRFVGVGRQADLRPVRLRGGQTIDPAVDDPFVRMVEERHRIDADIDRPEAERKRLSRFLKITANATAYGILARFDRHELSERVPLTIWGPDELPRRQRNPNPEDPGPYAFPPIAATITAAARLMLAMLERLVIDAGGTYAFCDTDSMAIVREGRASAINGLGSRTISEILTRFASLTPYDPMSQIPVWKVEHDSLTRPLTCVAISAKRYILTRSALGEHELLAIRDETDEMPADDDYVEVTDWSEHGLGVYMSPLVDVRGRAQRDTKGRRRWVEEAWQTVLADAVGVPAPELPEWGSLPAVTRFTISSPAVAYWFAGRDRDLPAEDRMHPGGFGLLAHPVEGDPAGRMPAAPYETKPVRWQGLDWYDRHSHDEVAITTVDPITDPERFASDVASGALRVSTFGDVISTYSRRAEHKSLAPAGGPVDGRTAGLLLRRPVASTPARTRLTGKEGNKLIERLIGVVTDESDYRSAYGTRAEVWDTLIVPVLRRMGVSEILRRTDPRWRRSIERIVKDGTKPKTDGRARLLATRAVGFVHEALPELLADDSELLRVFLATKPADRLCACGCGTVLTRASRWVNEAHRKRSGRHDQVRSRTRDERARTHTGG